MHLSDTYSTYTIVKLWEMSFGQLQLAINFRGIISGKGKGVASPDMILMKTVGQYVRLFSMI